LELEGQKTYHKQHKAITQRKETKHIQMKLSLPNHSQIDEHNPTQKDLPADDEKIKEIIEKMTAVAVKYPQAFKLIKQCIKNYEKAVKYKAKKTGPI
jgi:hypothetical protein